jgi:hypothetical protein
MAYIVGFVVALLTYALGKFAGFDRDRAFYATILIVVGHYYVLFAAEAGSTSALITELAAMSVFVAFAVAGFKFTPWLIPAGLVAHGLFDLVHGYVVTNPGVPTWWPAFCSTYDVVIGVVVALLIRGRAVKQPGATAYVSSLT